MGGMRMVAAASYWMRWIFWVVEEDVIAFNVKKRVLQKKKGILEFNQR